VNLREKPAEMAWLQGSRVSAAMKISGWEAAPQAAGLSFFAPDFALASAQPWLHGEEAPLELTPAPLPELVHRAEPSSADFANMHEEIIARIHLREFQKVVPIVCEEFEFAAPLHASMFTAALSPGAGKFAYGFEFGAEGMCGVTPEVLFAVRNGVLSTMALAGTGAAAGPSLLQDQKEMREHGLVIENICAELARFGRPDRGPTNERTYGALKHLYTPLQVKLNHHAEFMDLVVRLHPTAALGGWPRRPAVEWLEMQDFHTSRKRFGAPFGFVRDEGREMFCVVAIRGVQWQGECAMLSAGCGVVEGSQSLSEWKELELKRRATCESLGLSL
jgi:menaquinone-specific isochorismate synthase